MIEKFFKKIEFFRDHPVIKIVAMTLAFFAFMGDLYVKNFIDRPLKLQQFEEWRMGADDRKKQADEWKNESALRKKQYIQWNEDSIARAWQLLTTKSPGNSGKIWAIEYLAKKNQPFHGIDLSCASNGGWRKKTKLFLSSSTECSAGVYLAELTISGIDIHNSNFTGANFSKAKLNKVKFFDSNLTETQMKYASFKSSWFKRSNLSGAKFYRTDLTKVHFAAKINLKGVRLDCANISDTNFNGAKNLNQDQLNRAWAYRGHPPKKLPTGLVFKNFCRKEKGYCLKKYCNQRR